MRRLQKKHVIAVLSFVVGFLVLKYRFQAKESAEIQKTQGFAIKDKSGSLGREFERQKNM